MKLYPKFQEYFRQSKPPCSHLGKNDPFFIPLEQKHSEKTFPMRKFASWTQATFAIETHAEEIAAAMKEFFEANGISGAVGKGMSR